MAGGRHRFYVENLLMPGDDMRLPAHWAREVARVLRVRVGHPRILLNGTGVAVTTTVSEIERDIVASEEMIRRAR